MWTFSFPFTFLLSLWARSVIHPASLLVQSPETRLRRRPNIPPFPGKLGRSSTLGSWATAPAPWAAVLAGQSLLYCRPRARDVTNIGVVRSTDFPCAVKGPLLLFLLPYLSEPKKRRNKIVAPTIALAHKLSFLILIIHQ
jgi:hypothetical protein